ncbi:MAG: glycosyltransferase family 2 protein [Eubacteriales bacterium]
MSEPLISIIVPVYNTEKYLSKCIESILAQTYTNFELILVDDGSPDRCPGICDEYAEKDIRIKVIHKENGGVSSARNCGLDIASGEYIGFVDSDDYIEPKMYEKMLHTITAFNVDLCFCRCKAESSAGDFISESPPDSEDRVFTREDMLDFLVHKRLAKYICPPNKLYRKKLFAHNRYKIGKINEDEAIIHHIFGASDGTVFTNDILYRYVVRNGSIIHSRVSVKNLDMVDALIDRAEYFLDDQKKQHAASVYISAMDTLVTIYSQLDRTIDVQRTVARLREDILHRINEADFSEQNCKNKMKKFLFITSTNMYGLLVKVTAKLK